MYVKRGSKSCKPTPIFFGKSHGVSDRRLRGGGEVAPLAPHKWRRHCREVLFGGDGFTGTETLGFRPLYFENKLDYAQKIIHVKKKVAEISYFLGDVPR